MVNVNVKVQGRREFTGGKHVRLHVTKQDKIMVG